jgi:hypothetical protein
MLRRGPADPGGRPRRAHLGTGGVWSAAVLWLREGAGSTGRDHRRGPWRTGSGEVCDRGGMMRQSSRPATTSAVNGIRPLRATRVHHVTGTETLGGVEARVVGQGGRADRKRTLTAAFDAQRKSRLRAPPLQDCRRFVNAEVWVRRVRVLRFLKGGTDRQRRRDCCFDRSTGRPLAGSVQAPAVGGLSLARGSAREPCGPGRIKAEASRVRAVDQPFSVRRETQRLPGVSAWAVLLGGRVRSRARGDGLAGEPQ